MEQIFKTFTGLVLLFLMTFTGIGIISSAIDASNAENFASTAASVIEAGNYSEEAIASCTENAKKANYDLQVSLIDSNHDGYDDMAEVIVSYDYSIPILNVTGTKHEARVVAK